jgi:hypothetical protein
MVPWKQALLCLDKSFPLSFLVRAREEAAKWEQPSK